MNTYRKWVSQPLKFLLVRKYLFNINNEDASQWNKVPVHCSSVFIVYLEQAIFYIITSRYKPEANRTHVGVGLVSSFFGFRQIFAHINFRSFIYCNLQCISKKGGCYIACSLNSVAYSKISRILV